MYHDNRHCFSSRCQTEPSPQNNRRHIRIGLYAAALQRTPIYCAPICESLTAANAKS